MDDRTKPSRPRRRARTGGERTLTVVAAPASRWAVPVVGRAVAARRRRRVRAAAFAPPVLVFAKPPPPALVLAAAAAAGPACVRAPPRPRALFVVHGFGASTDFGCLCLVLVWFAICNEVRWRHHDKRYLYRVSALEAARPYRRVPCSYPVDHLLWLHLCSIF